MYAGATTMNLCCGSSAGIQLLQSAHGFPRTLVLRQIHSQRHANVNSSRLVAVGRSVPARQLIIHRSISTTDNSKQRQISSEFSPSIHAPAANENDLVQSMLMRGLPKAPQQSEHVDEASKQVRKFVERWQNIKSLESYCRVVRGIGWQRVGAFANLGAYYGVGLPMTFIFVFVFHFDTRGLLLGMGCGLVTQLVTLMVIILRTDWDILAKEALLRSNSYKSQLPTTESPFLTKLHEDEKSSAVSDQQTSAHVE